MQFKIKLYRNRGNLKTFSCNSGDEIRSSHLMKNSSSKIPATSKEIVFQDPQPQSLPWLKESSKQELPATTVKNPRRSKVFFPVSR